MTGTTFDEPLPDPEGADELYRDTLRWINALRVEYRMEKLTKLLPGEQAHAYECPVARSLPGDAVTMCGEFKIDSGPWRKLPRAMRRFQQKFDRGDYPWLIEGGAEA